MALLAVAPSSTAPPSWVQGGLRRSGSPCRSGPSGSQGRRNWMRSPGAAICALTVHSARVRAGLNGVTAGFGQVTAHSARSGAGMSRLTAHSAPSGAGMSRLTALSAASGAGMSRLTAHSAASGAGMSRVTAHSAASGAGMSRLTAHSARSVTAWDSLAGPGQTVGIEFGGPGAAWCRSPRQVKEWQPLAGSCPRSLPTRLRPAGR